jgi:hypothetical protein
MNARPISALILAAALSVSAPLFAASQDASPTSISLRTLVASSNGDMKNERGTSREDVSYAMRYKSRVELSPDVWVYSGYHADAGAPNAQDCGSVVITFAHGEVADLQLVNKPAVAAIAANLRLGSPSRNLASR